MKYGLAATGCALALPACGGDRTEDVKPVAFRASVGTETREIFAAAGLTLRAGCSDNGGRPHLSVAAGTDVDDAVISSQFDAAHAPRGGHRFVMDDFDRSFGGWDFLGKGKEDLTGTLEYGAPNGGHVTVSFLADEGSGQTDCIFTGTAIVAEA